MALFVEALEYEKRCADEVAAISSQKEDMKIQIYRNLRSKRVKMGKKMQRMPEAHELQIYVDSEGLLHFPVLILYDEFMMTDFIQDWREDQTFKEALKPVFAEPLPWDEYEDYNM